MSWEWKTGRSWRRWLSAARRSGIGRVWPVGLILVLVLGSLPAADAQSLTPTLQLSAPRQVKLGAPIQISLAVRDAADLAGYETTLVFDTSAAELNGVSQRHGDLKSLGRDIHTLGPVEHSGSISFGLYSCPVAMCVDRASPRHAQGANGHVQLATIELATRKPGLLELRFSHSRFVDASGKTLNVDGAEQT